MRALIDMVHNLLGRPAMTLGRGFVAVVPRSAACQVDMEEESTSTLPHTSWVVSGPRIDEVC